MLRCPKCNCTCYDDTQIFCTGDGSRLLPINQAEVEESANSKPSRRTPPGELLFEIFMSPPNTSAAVKKVVSANGKSSFQRFGLRSSNILDAAPETESASGFHSFDSLIVHDQKTELGDRKTETDYNEVFEENFVDGIQSTAKRKFSASLFLYCLLGAVLFLTGLAFAANYFF